MSYTKTINEYLSNSSWLVKENANQVRSWSQLRGYIADDAVKNYTLSKYPKEIREMHEYGDIHIHDLVNGLIPYCNGIDLYKLLSGGLWTTHIVSSKPKHLSSALSQLVNFFTTSQNEWAGAQAAGDFNTLLAPYIAKDNMSYSQILQCMQQFMWDLNYPSRSSNETPFTNIMFNAKTPHNWKDEPVCMDGVDGTYSDYENESMLILKAFNDVLSKGDAENNPFTFPIPTINLIPEADFTNEIWNDIAKTVAKYGVYYFMNYIGSGISANSVRSMCCRLQLDMNELSETGGRWAYQGSTGSIGVVTINLPRLGYLNGNIFDSLENILEKCKQSLLLKDSWIKKTYDDGLMPVTHKYGVNFNRYFRTIGLLGLHEMCVNITGKPIWDKDSTLLVIQVMKYIKSWLKKTQKETGMIWNSELVPGESCSTRLAMLDRKYYPGMFTQGTESAPYYSTLVTPSNSDISIGDKIELEEKILPEFTGGTVFRLYMGERNPHPESIWKIITRLAETKIPYFDLAATYGICNKCNSYQSGTSFECSRCGGDMRIYQRITGYYRPIHQANIGKIQEFNERKYSKAFIPLNAIIS